MPNLNTRLQKIEARRPVSAAPVKLVDLSEMHPAVQAFWMELGGDINKMTLDQLEMYDAELARLSE